MRLCGEFTGGFPQEGSMGSKSLCFCLQVLLLEEGPRLPPDPLRYQDRGTVCSRGSAAAPFEIYDEK